MSKLNTTTVATRPTTLNNTTDVGKSYFETDTKKLLVWDGTGFNEWNKDATITPGYNNNYSVYFDGTGDYARLSSAISLSGAFTLSGWFRDDSNVTAARVLLGEISGGDIVLYTINDDLAMQGFGGTQTTSGVSIARDGSTWYHFAVIRDSSNNIDIYINGTSRMSVTNKTATASLEYFGGDFPDYPAQIWNGYIDDIAIWFSDQTSNLSTIYDSSSGTPQDLSTLSPDHWWRMGDTSGDTTTITDVGYGSSLKDMTLTNAVISATVPS